MRSLDAAEGALDALRKRVRPTTPVYSERLNQEVGAQVLIASETFQHTGSFKFRAAYNMAQATPHSRLIAASSGNFGQALAYACALLGKRCTVVMPANSVQVKVEAVKRYGGNVELVDVSTKGRAQRVQELAAETPAAAVVSAYDHPAVIAGNSTLGEEIAAMKEEFAAVIVPLGGGGLLSGIIEGLRRSGSSIPVYGAEPLMANDAARSIREGRLFKNESEPQTIADGARTLSLGECNWAIVRNECAGIIEVPEETIIQALRHLFSFANLKVEPTGALALGALISAQSKFREKKVCCIASGGNADPELYCKLIAV